MSNDITREKALANFELLLELWQIQYKKVTTHEYDLLATWRQDRNYGSCRFNIDKGRGADFAGLLFSDVDFKLLGPGFTKDDYSGFAEGSQAKVGFDIVGLCQRIYNLNDYSTALKYLSNDLRAIAQTDGFTNPSADAADRRRREQELKIKERIEQSNTLWESCKYHKLEGSLGQKYLNTRGIITLDKNIRFHPNIFHGPSKKNFPALIFKVQEYYDGPLVAIHRIFLSPDGTGKAKVDNPKMALAPIRGAGIWFGEPCSELYILEGPENALTMKEMGAGFVWCSVFSTNMPNIKIPSNVNKIIIAPDPDPSGEISYEKLRDNLEPYAKLGTVIKKLTIPTFKKKNGKYADLNDIYVGAL